MMKFSIFVGVMATTIAHGCRLELKNGRIVVDGEEWFELGAPCVRWDGSEQCNFDNEILESEIAKDQQGMDDLGRFEEKRHAFELGQDKTWEINFRRYLDQENIMTFGQRFHSTLEGTQAPGKSTQESGNNGMSSWFPSFKTKSLTSDAHLGILRYHGFMSGTHYRVERWSHAIAKLGGLESGPVVLFSESCAVVVSPSASFTASSNLFDPTKEELGFGVMGSVTTIPQGHMTNTILVASRIDNTPDGIRRAMSSWGLTLRALYQTKRARDVTVEYLQYSTDNGAYYYYLTEPGKNYEDTIIDVKQHVDEIGLPVRQWLMDSWWYFKGLAGGVKNWTAMPQVFPNGIRSLRDKTGWEIVAHNRYWSANTDYAKQNGGDYEFVIEGDYALPLEQRFWEDLFQSSKAWGMTVYEQDWLNIQFLNMNHTMATVDGARNWIMQMGRAAEIHNVNIQYCMCLPREAMQSLEASAVTQIRVSDDYQPGNDNWKAVGTTSMFAHALGLVPTKDNFWSTPNQHFKNRYGNRPETASRLHAIVSTFSTGPVAPSDKIGLLDKDLIMKSCAQDGKLLRPDVPAARTDNAILQEAGFSLESEQAQEVWITFVELAGFVYNYYLAATGPAFVLTEKDLLPSVASSVKELVAWDLDRPFEPLEIPIAVPATTKENFHAYGIAPVFPNQWAFLGEAETKWVPVSRDRFSQLRITEDGFGVLVHGAVSEVVEMIVRKPSKEFVKVRCKIPSHGVTHFSTKTMQCAHSAKPNLRKELIVSESLQ